MSRSVFRTLSAFALFGFVALIVGAQSPPPAPPLTAEEKTAKIVVNLLERAHMAKPTIDDEIAKKWCKTFIKDLDPQKIYFLKADVDEFLPQATNLDDLVKKGNIDFAKDVFKRFLKRSDERLAMVQDIVKQKPDFTIDESMSDDAEKMDYPVNDDEARERMRKRVKLELLQAKVDGDKEDGKEEDAVKKLLIRYRDRNRMVNQFTISDWLEFYLSSLSRTFDPHTSYMSKDSYEDFMNQSIQLSLTGIGASLQSEDGFAVIKELIPGGPADKDGRLQPEDKILGIERPDGTEIDFVEKRLKDVVRQIRGEANTHVRLIIQPSDSKDRKVYDIVRQKVEMTESHAKGQIIETKLGGKTINVGVINLPNFYGDGEQVSCSEDCRRLIEGFKDKGVELVMMDLRGNGGGLLSEAVKLSGLFIGTGPVVQVRKASGVEHLDDDDDSVAWEGPFVLLTDRQSASASEIFAGVIKDYGRGLIIGDSSTYGKGTVQQLVPISESFLRRNDSAMGALKLTIQQFYRANGDSTQIKGVEPDIHIPSILDQADFGEGKQENALKFDHVAARPHDQYNRVPTELLTQLTDRSAKRRAESEKFQKRDAAIKKLIDRKNRHEISLNEAKFKADVISEDETKDEAKTKVKEKKKRLTDHPAWEPNFYNDEILNIVTDYMNLGSKAFTAAPIRAAANN